MARLQLTDEQFADFSRLVYERSGMDIARNQKTHLELAIDERAAARSIRDLVQYRDTLVREEGEFVAFIDRLVVQETSFFRTPAHFDALREKILPGVLGAARADKTIQVWSAGCASGPEPYSLAITLLEATAARRGWKARVLATDIGVSSLGEAKAALYEERLLRKTPSELRDRYFQKEGSLYRVHSSARALVEFRRHNLMEGDYPSSLDVIFCRNVLIYFRPESRAKILAGFHSALRPGGYIFLGHSESLRDFGQWYEPVWFEGGFGYRRREPAATQVAAQAVPMRPFSKKSTRVRKRLETRVVFERLKTFAPASDPVTVLQYRGHLGDEEPSDKDRLLAAIRRKEEKLIVRLDAPEFLGEEDLLLLRRAVRMVREYGGRVVLLCPEGAARKWLANEEDRKLFALAATEEEARASLSAPPHKA